MVFAASEVAEGLAAVVPLLLLLQAERPRLATAIVATSATGILVCFKEVSSRERALSVGTASAGSAPCIHRLWSDGASDHGQGLREVAGRGVVGGQRVQLRVLGLAALLIAGVELE